jgi:hypothetical protein
MQLFPNAEALKQSGYLSRITDNGGETYDRITVTFSDGDAILCTLGSLCAHIEQVDVQRDADDVEAGTARDLRWIDLAPGLQARILSDLNEGFSGYIEAAPAAASRDEARDWQGLWSDYTDERTPIYRDGNAFRIRDDENGDSEPFESFRDAVFYMLPQDYDLSGPEYHTTVDLWDTEGGPADPWDREADPPVIDEHNEQARVVITHDTGGEREQVIAWFATVRDAENFLGTSATIDPDDLHEGKYSICDHDDPDAS